MPKDQIDARPLIQHGLLPHQMDEAAALYWSAFGREILPFPVSTAGGTRLIRKAMRPQSALVACEPDGRIIALAGIRDASGGFIDPAARHFRIIWGAARGRLLDLALGCHRGGPDSHDLIVDGLIVRPEARGQGFGQALVHELARIAHARGFPGLRVEVAAGNLAAANLYRSLGFVAIGQSRIGWPWSGQAEIMRLGPASSVPPRSSRSPEPAM